MWKITNAALHFFILCYADFISPGLRGKPPTPREIPVKEGKFAAGVSGSLHHGNT